MAETIQADFIIVGAGSAGCVLANRLSADPRNRVLLLEAGGDDRPTRNLGQFFANILIHTPAGFSRVLKDNRVNWNFPCEPDEAGRVQLWPRGKVLGGSSSINGMLYVRGQHADYDGWRQLGCEGWSWDDVRPYFMRAQHQERGADDLHGADGPLNVMDLRHIHVVSEAAVEAAVQAGLPRNRDINGADQEGVGFYQVTARAGQRCSTAVAYLHPVMNRPNLTVETNALTCRVIFEGRRATGVEFLQHGQRRIARATREVILASGAIGSPHILQLSGVGPGDLLQDHGVPVVADLAGVGGNLQDHYSVGSAYRLKPGSASLNELSHGLPFARETLRYALTRRGLLSQSSAQVAVFCKSRPDLAHPDIQFHIMPASLDQKLSADRRQLVLEQEPGMTMAICQLRPESRGDLRLKSPDPSVYPSIRPNYLADPLDQQVIVAGLRWARRIAAQPALSGYVDHERTPGPDAEADEALLAYARRVGTTVFHPVGTCQMGHGAMAVVDPQLRVRGVEGLRVVDASIMPRLVSGNTNAPVIMIAEKASDMILEIPAAVAA